jgi:hypothetical protein
LPIIRAGTAVLQDGQAPISELSPHETRPQKAKKREFHENDIELTGLEDDTTYIFDVSGLVSTGTGDWSITAETAGGYGRTKGQRAWNRTHKWKPPRDDIPQAMKEDLWSRFYQAGTMFARPKQDYAICLVSNQRTILACNPAHNDKNKASGHIISDFYHGPTKPQNLIPEGTSVNCSHGKQNLIDYMVGAWWQVEPRRACLALDMPFGVRRPPAVAPA